MEKDCPSVGRIPWSCGCWTAPGLGRNKRRNNILCIQSIANAAKGMPEKLKLKHYSDFINLRIMIDKIKSGPVDFLPALSCLSIDYA
jgi:hypothetical protein